MRGQGSISRIMKKTKSDISASFVHSLTTTKSNVMLKLITIRFIVNLLISCSNGTITNDSIPIYDSFTTQTESLLEERVINVWKPSGYNESIDSLPVLYMPDGGTKEDFPHIANTLAKRFEAQKIEPIILVGIENTERGRDLTGASTTAYDKQFCPVTDGAKVFRAFISKELVPSINLRCHTTGIKGIVGESFAGLFVMETFLISPSTFDFYIAMDPSFWWDHHFLIENTDLLLSGFTAKIRSLWYAGSSAEEISKHTKGLSITFRKLAPQNLTWKYSDQPKKGHNTIFKATKEQAFIWAINLI